MQTFIAGVSLVGTEVKSIREGKANLQDAFAYFKEEGIFNKDVATKFKDNVLSQGGTENPMVLYKRFRGAEPKVEALLERAGLLPKSA